MSRIPAPFRFNGFPIEDGAPTREFQFRTPGPLVDRELELVVPQDRWIDELLKSCRHPLTRQDSPGDSSIAPEQVRDFLYSSPGGREPADPTRDRCPAYHFWMLLLCDPSNPKKPPPVRIAGGCVLRIGSTESIERWFGHIGYHVYPPARGNGYAERSARLLFSLARAHGLKHLWITCNPDNLPSRRTCEKLGGVLKEIVPVPETESIYRRGDRFKCRFRINL